MSMKGRAIVFVMLLLVACTTVRREPGKAAFYQACIDATTDAVVLNAQNRVRYDRWG